MDIISFSKEHTGVEVKFTKLETEDPFKFGQRVLNLLIKYNNSKRYAIKTSLNINSNVPKTIYSDEIRIKQVLINLLTNAYKFTSSGQINIEVDVINSWNFYDEIQVKVEDTGIGISVEDENKLFKQFGKLNDYLNKNVEKFGTGNSTKGIFSNLLCQGFCA